MMITKAETTTLSISISYNGSRNVLTPQFISFIIWLNVAHSKQADPLEFVLLFNKDGEAC
jgi:hypothetical protein